MWHKRTLFVTQTYSLTETPTVAGFLSCAQCSFKCLMDSHRMRGIFCLRLHSVSFPPGLTPVLTAALWPSMLLHWDHKQSLIRDFLAPLKLCSVLTSLCSTGFCSQTCPDYKASLSFDSCAPMFHFSGPAVFCVRVACRSFDHHPPARVTVKFSAAERSPGRPSMALSLPLGDNAFFPCHKADAVL